MSDKERTFLTVAHFSKCDTRFQVCLHFSKCAVFFQVREASAFICPPTVSAKQTGVFATEFRKMGLSSPAVFLESILSLGLDQISINLNIYDWIPFLTNRGEIFFKLPCFQTL